MYLGLAHALKAADADRNVRAVMLHGTKDCFTSGNDITDFLQRPPHDDGAPTWRFFDALPGMQKPVVAAVGGLGIVTAVVSAENLFAEAEKAAAALAALPPDALRLSKQLIRSHHRGALEKTIAEESRVVRERLASPEAKEAMSAFLEKRKPDFS